MKGNVEIEAGIFREQGQIQCELEFWERRRKIQTEWEKKYEQGNEGVEERNEWRGWEGGMMRGGTE